jgi:hypothetical protein
MQEISWLAEDLVASQEGFCSTELSYFVGHEKFCNKQSVRTASYLRSQSARK